DHGSFGNQVSATVTDLPVHVSDPVERLAAVRAEQDSLKASHEAMIGQALVSLGRYSVYPLTSWLVRKAFSLPQREIVTVTTNVPGPREPLYWMGRRLEEIIPYVPIASMVRTGISIFSYDGTVTFGITGDYAANPDLDVLARGIDHDLSELLLAAGGTRFRRQAEAVLRPHLIEERGDLPGQPGGAYPQLGERAGTDQPRVRKLAREPLRVGERVDQVDPVPEHQRRRGDGPPLFDGRGDGTDQHAPQDGGDLVRVRPDEPDQRVERADAR